MSAQNLSLAGKRFVILPKQEFAQLKQRADRNRPSRKKTSKSARVLNRASPIETYSNRRIAEFLLSNSVDAEDYARACEEVRKMGLNPAKIRHYRPRGVR